MSPTRNVSAIIFLQVQCLEKKHEERTSNELHYAFFAYKQQQRYRKVYIQRTTPFASHLQPKSFKRRKLTIYHYYRQTSNE